MQALLTKISLNCGGRLISLDQPMVMGILNATPDSFFGESRVNHIDEMLRRVEKMLAEGADILDIGGQSTRPGAELIGEEEELRRVEPIIVAIKQRFPETLLSIDTYFGSVAKVAAQIGAHIINDVSGGDFDAHMLPTVAQLRLPYVLMHKKGEANNMHQKTSSEDVVLEVCNYFTEKIAHLRSLGIKDIILDPGFGFGKTLEGNYTLLRNLDHLKLFELPVLVGVSRKSMIQKVIQTNSESALNGTTALHMIALERGAKILRVHDVKEAKECIALYQSLFPSKA